MTIKLVASDMDDTLLNSEHKISETNKTAIKKAIAAGKIFLLATGRLYKGAVPYAQDLGLDVPMITYNGALVKGSMSGKVYYEHKMKITTAQKVLDYCKQNGYYVQFYSGSDEILVEKITSYSVAYSKIIGTPIKAIGKDFYQAKEAPYKMLLVLEGDVFEQRWREFERDFAGLLDVTSSKTNFLELMEPGVNKWEAVKSVAASYGVKPEEILCMGDSNNDIPMIANAGVGVAVANAKDIVKKSAKYVTTRTNDDDAVAEVIAKVLEGSL
ncbi:MAG: Cof-type HAD-IIB family hydrolase [Phascolarctobacterium sp.]|nr:Cof-type HAD-IIB family hydrolase [Phascolarctobacterium sp.]